MLPYLGPTNITIFSENKIERCHFLKIDCEGAEHEIIATTSHAVFQRIDRIVLEYHLPPIFNVGEDCSLEKIVSRLKNEGYSLRVKFENVGRGLIFARRVL